VFPYGNPLKSLGKKKSHFWRR